MIMLFNVSKVIVDDAVPVVSEPAVILKPFTDESVQIIIDYYDYQQDSEKQQNSLIYNEGTYMQNTGIIYGKVDSFDVISILDGVVNDIKTDPLLGTVVEIEHDNNIISIYESLGETTLKKGDSVLRGQIIGSSGTSNLNPEIGSHLLFELVIDGINVNPENYYGKTLKEL